MIPPKGKTRKSVPGRRRSLCVREAEGPESRMTAPLTPKHTHSRVQASSAGRGNAPHTQTPAPGLEPSRSASGRAGTRHHLSGAGPNFAGTSAVPAGPPPPSRHLRLCARPQPAPQPRGRLGSARPGRARQRPPAQSGPEEPDLGRRPKAALSPSSPSSPPHPRDLRRLRGCPGLRPPREPHGERELSDPARLRRRGRGQVWARGGGGGGGGGPGAPPELRPRRAAGRGRARAERGGRRRARQPPPPCRLLGNLQDAAVPCSLSCPEAFSLER